MGQFLKINRNDKCKVFVWSDIHEKHSKDFILNPRSFTSVEHAQKETRKRWNDKVTNDDIGFLLGDTVVGAGTEGQKVFTELLYSLNFKELYVMGGNHPSGWSHIVQKLQSENIFPDEHWRYKWQLNDNKIVYLIPNYFEIVIEGQIVIMSHYPILSWNKMGDKHSPAFMLYGHVHNNLRKTEWIRNNYMKGKNHDLSIESSPDPLEFAEIQEIMRPKKVLHVDHHGPETI